MSGFQLYCTHINEALLLKCAAIVCALAENVLVDIYIHICMNIYKYIYTRLCAKGEGIHRYVHGLKRGESHINKYIVTDGE